MNLSFYQIEKAAKEIRKKIETGELIAGCSMSAVPAPVGEAWEITQELTANNSLSSVQKQELFSKLDKRVQLQLEETGYDDFDLVYEYLLQNIGA